MPFIFIRLGNPQVNSVKTNLTTKCIEWKPWHLLGVNCSGLHSICLFEWPGLKKLFDAQIIV